MRINRLPRTGMYRQAYNHIKELEPSYLPESIDEVLKTGKYDPKFGTTSAEIESLYKRINKWLDKHYDMFILDVTHFYDSGSRSEVVLCYTKRTEPFELPDFSTELPKLVLAR